MKSQSDPFSIDSLGGPKTPARLLHVRTHVPECHYLADESKAVLREAQQRLVWAHRLIQPLRPLTEPVFLYEVALDRAAKKERDKNPRWPQPEKPPVDREFMARMEAVRMRKPIVPKPARKLAQPKKRRQQWPDEDILIALQLWFEEHGEAPRQSDWNQSSPYWPSHQTVANHFGTWAKGLDKAGVPRRPRVQKVSSEALLGLRADGLSYREIAKELGVNIATVARRLRKLGAPERPPPKDLRKRRREQRIADLQKALTKGE